MPQQPPYDDDRSLIVRDERLPSAVESSVAIEEVRRYILAERARSRRVVVWTSTIFILIVLLVLTLFITVGIHVVRSSRDTTERVDNLAVRTHQIALETEGMTDRIGAVETNTAVVRELVHETETSRKTESRMFKTDLERFGRWMTARSDARLGNVDVLAQRVQRMEELLDIRQQQVADLERKYAAALAQQQPGGPGGARPAPPQNVPTPSSPPSGGAPASPTVTADLVGQPDRSEPEARAPRGVLRDTDRDETASAVQGARDVSVIAFPNGDRYEGQLRHGLLHGWGVYTYHNKDRYEGNFKDDMKHGYGVLYYHNGDMYKGEFAADKRHGQGTYVFSNGSRYVGSFENGLRHGRGRFIYESGQEYIGEFKDGEVDGPGFSVVPATPGPASG